MFVFFLISKLNLSIFNFKPVPKIDIPNIDVPITHETPKTTIDSLAQIKSEFSQKLQEAVAKNDSSKKRRYERQIKVIMQFFRPLYRYLYKAKFEKYYYHSQLHIFKV